MELATRSLLVLSGGYSWKRRLMLAAATRLVAGAVRVGCRLVVGAVRELAARLAGGGAGRRRGSCGA
ncbi:hypothetical protein PVL29_015977 [Vitis rotundifolia]|uniref:Uncharacterized protein n=1 Tax=Vitis rotundifolia TaxID=103349 RepID=A0AA38ZE98_VITRO|nr:hypothetical protein PVL29_015976 [Vitis rotundifolia]KAJ9687302.1 hypothetical protein PVL29_015977 [Vitis rotundifolia]